MDGPLKPNDRYPKALLLTLGDHEELVHELRGKLIDVQVALTIADALPLLSDGSVDCVLLDGSMPRQDRLQRRRALRERGGGSPPTIIVRRDDPSILDDLATKVHALLERSSRPPPPRQPSRLSVTAKTILVVDDDPRIRRAVSRSLKRLPANVIEAEDAEGALGILQTVAIDLVISDYTLGTQTNGLELLGAVRTLAPDVRRILLTGHSLEDGLAGEIDAAEQIIQKPWETSALTQACLTLLDS